jgi:hypothetical protein
MLQERPKQVMYVRHSVCRHAGAYNQRLWACRGRPAQVMYVWHSVCWHAGADDQRKRSTYRIVSSSAFLHSIRLGIFGKVFGWCDTTEEQARFTLHSHILLFIALFDALITLLWSNYEKVREEAQKELVEFLKKTMSSTYDLVEEDFIHETSLSTSNIQDDDNTFLKKP